MRAPEPALFRALVRKLHARSIAGAALVPAACGTLVMAACGTQGSVMQAEVHIPPQPSAPPAKVLRAAGVVAKPAASADPGAPMDEGDDDETADDSDTCGDVDARSVSRPQGACNDMTPPASVAVCRGCGQSGFGASKCATYKQLFKPRIAKVALDCLAGLGGRCDSCAVYACGDRAMKGSCPDPSADVECRALAKLCPAMPIDICGRYMSALLPAGRAKLKACMSRCSLYSCAEGL